MITDLKTAIHLFQEYKLDEAQEAFELIFDQNNSNLDVILYLGRIHSRTQNYGEALNFYNRAIEIDKDNATAKTGIQLIKNILQLTNNFYFENSYTDDDLYDM